jgi:hypothetical protein
MNRTESFREVLQPELSIAYGRFTDLVITVFVLPFAVGNAFHLAMITWVVRLPATSTAPKKREI